MDTTATVVALLGVAMFSFGDRASAIQDSEDEVLFGPIGITPGERALINVYAISTSQIGNPDELPPWEFAVRVFKRRSQLVQDERFRVRVGAIGSVEVAIQDEAGLALQCVAGADCDVPKPAVTRTEKGAHCDYEMSVYGNGPRRHR